jgi:hypothetical protein
MSAFGIADVKRFVWFGYIKSQNFGEEFWFAGPEERKGRDRLEERDKFQILKALDGVLPDLAKALGRDSLSYSEVMDIFQQHPLSPLVRGVALAIATNLAQNAKSAALTADVTLEPLDSNVQGVASVQQLDTLLSDQSSVPVEQVQAFVTMFRNLLPNTKRELMESVRQLPGNAGGRPEVLTLQQRKEMVDEVSRLLGFGMKLKVIFSRLARRYNVSLSTVRRVWYEDKPSLSAESTADDLE